MRQTSLKLRRSKGAQILSGEVLVMQLGSCLLYLLDIASLENQIFSIAECSERNGFHSSCETEKQRMATKAPSISQVGTLWRLLV